MIDHSQVQLASMAIHRVGNRHHGEACVTSTRLLQLDSEQEALLLNFLLKPFSKCTEVYRFVEMANNEMPAIAKGILDSPETLLERSSEILDHLYAQSDHPHIKSGELLVVHFKTMGFEDAVMDTLGIFKAETLSPYFKFEEAEDGMELIDDFGVNATKLDKGCLIMNTDHDTGFRILTVDANSYDAAYWKLNFLGLEQANDHHFQTRRHVELVKEFSKEVYAPNNRTEQIAFVNEAVQYMQDNGSWEDDDFGVTVLRNDDLRSAFNDYRDQFSERAGVPLENSFDISMPELEHQRRKYRNRIDLDTRISINLPFSPDGSQPHIERGYDEEKGMFFYKVFFNREQV